ncbi:MAG: NADP-dependent oxidoreductase [Pontibacterium sp.]
MKAIRIHQFGDTSNLNYEDIPKPTLSAGEVLIKNEACGVNPIDWKTCSGGGAAPFIGDLPFVPGWEFAGVIDQVAEDVADFSPGDNVFGMIRFPEPAGCYAEYIAAPAGEISLRPNSLDSKTAGGLCTAGLTAWQALFDKGQLKAGQRVLILGAAGGVGHIAVQLAKWAGAEVIGTASEKNHDFLRALGADQLCDYQSCDITTTFSELDLIIDAVGGDTGLGALDCLAQDGTLVTLPSVTKDLIIAAGDAKGLNVLPIRAEANAEQLKEIAALYDQGKLQLNLAQSFPLSQVAEAFKLSASGHVRGKLVLTP